MLSEKNLHDLPLVEYLSIILGGDVVSRDLDTSISAHPFEEAGALKLSERFSPGELLHTVQEYYQHREEVKLRGVVMFDRGFILDLRYEDAGLFSLNVTVNDCKVAFDLAFAWA